MSSVRVDALDLKLRAPDAMRPAGDSLKSRAGGRFVPAVLGAMERRLNRVYGDKAVIRIRRLRMRCGMRPGELDELRLAEAIGEDLASHVEQLVQRERGSGRLPAPSAAVQVYRDPAHLEAAELIAAAARTAGPSGELREFAELWSRTAAAKPAYLHQVLARCMEARRLEPVLARLSVAELGTLAPRVAGSRISGLADAVARARASRRPARKARPAARPEEAAPTATDGVQAPSRRAARKGRRKERSLPPGSAAPPTEPEAVREQAAEPTTDARVERQARKPAPVHEPAVRPARSEAIEPEKASRRVPEAPPVPAAAELPPAPARIEPPEPDEPEPGEIVAIPSGWCALLYLVNVAQRLELPERLWQIGVDEGAVLAAAFSRLAGTEDDPAPLLLSSAFPEAPPPVPAVPDWARDEIRTGAIHAAERRLALPPEPLRERIAALETWFATGPDFDLPGWCAAFHLAVAEAWLGRTLAPGTVADLFARPGRIEVEADEYRVVQPLAAIDLDMRRAGLDADPGLLPWLGRTLRFVFEGEEG